MDEREFQREKLKRELGSLLEHINDEKAYEEDRDREDLLLAVKLVAVGTTVQDFTQLVIKENKAKYADR